MTGISDRHITQKDLADLLNVTPSILDDWYKNDYGPAVVMFHGKHNKLYLKKSVERFLAGQYYH